MRRWWSSSRPGRWPSIRRWRHWGRTCWPRRRTSGTAVSRLRASERRDVPVGEALLDQRALAGLGNVYRSELCFIERVDPFLPVGQVDPAVLHRLVESGARLLRANRDDPRRTTTPDALGAPPGSTGPGTAVARRDGDRLWVYGRTGRPCRRCGTLVRSAVSGVLPRRVWWCPGCQPAGAGGVATGTGSGSTAAVARRADAQHRSRVTRRSRRPRHAADDRLTGPRATATWPTR